MATSPNIRKPVVRAALARLPNPRRDFYVYGINLLAIPPGAPAQGAIQIQADSEFELQKLSFFADIAQADQTANTRVLPLCTLQITDTGTGRQVFNTDIPIPAIMGDGQIPFILPTTKTFAPNSSVTITLGNYSSATTYNVRLALIGTKVFHYG